MIAGRPLNSSALKAMLAVCLFYASFGGLIQWFPIWLIDARGFTGEQLGLVISLAGVGRIVAGPLTSAWADGRSDRRAPIKLLAAITLMALGGLWFSQSFGISFALAFAAEVTFWALIAFLEAALLRLCHPGAVPNYGLARGLASLSFVVGNIATGMLVDAIGTDGIWWWLTLTTVGLIAATFGMKPEPVARDREPPFGQRLADGLSMVKRPEFALLMFGCGLIQAGHQFYYIFGTKLWIDEIGISATAAGWLFALGAIMEALFLMFIAPRIEHVRPASLMLIGGIGALVRWSLMATSPGLGLIVLLQCLHAVSFACTFLGAMRGIQQMWGDDRTPTAQMMFMALATAPAQALASWIAGRVFDSGVGSDGYLAMLSVVGVGTALVFLLWRRTPRPALAQ
ncbi:MFS transporter [Sandaracinobacteroides hominis]|uniref:MFS transporter n=1 Tax=Sandaracinobacteroides hominis TaxID=2780086 RepID=UPI0018F4D04E|nr:MFS transporter [Sandaracinobacteroides hominis]